MIQLKQCHYISADELLSTAIKKIDEGTIGIVLVLNDEFKLLGTVTDGDIRRLLLRGLGLDSKVSAAMKHHCIHASIYSKKSELLKLAKEKAISQIPLVDRNGVVKGIARTIDLNFEEEQNTIKYPNEVIIMAGGLGQRLMPLTEHTPKPMLNIGDRPILETIIRSFSIQGFKKITISVNYLSEQIIDYFGDGSSYGVEIRYIKEREKLGTAGALSLLEEIPQAPFFVINGDLLTNVNFRQLLDFHIDAGVLATMSVKHYPIELPYGVIKVENHLVVGVEEKPLYNFLINAGIYVVNPDFLEFVPRGIHSNMTSVISEVIQQGQKISCFPIWEHWLDIGRPEDFAKASSQFEDIFS